MCSLGHNNRRMDTIGILPHALLELPGGHMLVVTSVGEQPHAAGWGPTDFRAFLLAAHPGLSVGVIINTPWGSCEVIAQPARCRIGRRLWDGKLKYGEAGTLESVSVAIAAAKATRQELHRLIVEPCA